MTIRASRVAALDGLRGIAILLVILFHHSLLGVGWIGVQLFFVISGFLITSNLVRDRALAPGAFFGGFYWRRALRIFPVYFAYLAFLVFLDAVAGKARELAVDWPYLVTYTYNLTNLRPGFVFSSWFGHFWSLCIEEQFYLLWPMIVYVLRPDALRLTVLGMIAAAPMCRAATAFFLAGHLKSDYAVGDAVYWFTLSHMDGFAFGAAVAVLPVAAWFRQPVRWLSAACAVALLLGLGNLALLAYSGRLPAGENWTTLGYAPGAIAHGQHIWGYSVLNAMGAFFVLCAAQGHLAWLARPWLIYVGRISYGAYVVHQAVIVLVKKPLERLHLEGGAGGALLLLCVTLPITLGIAAASYHWFEQRFMSLRDWVAATKAIEGV
jgi:peptidoglycan/LPS O-acetylase OafA/YrhL